MSNCYMSCMRSCNTVMVLGLKCYLVFIYSTSKLETGNSILAVIELLSSYFMVREGWSLGAGGAYFS